MYSVYRLGCSSRHTLVAREADTSHGPKLSASQLVDFPLFDAS